MDLTSSSIARNMNTKLRSSQPVSQLINPKGDLLIIWVIEYVVACSCSNAAVKKFLISLMSLKMKKLVTSLQEYLKE